MEGTDRPVPSKIDSGTRRVEPPTRPSEPAGFTILPRRWVVEKSFAWIGKYRRLSKDYEGSLHHSESMAYLAMSRLILNRISKKH